MMIQIISHVVCSFLGTVAFAVMFNIPAKYYLSGGLTGVAGWMMYMFLTEGIHLSSAMATFWGTFVVVLISRMLTVRLRCPITVFLIAGIIPLVPGARVYFMAYHLMIGELSMAVSYGMNAVKLAFAIVLGIVFVVAIPRQFFQKGYWKQWRIIRAPLKVKKLVDRRGK